MHVAYWFGLKLFSVGFEAIFIRLNFNFHMDFLSIAVSSRFINNPPLDVNKSAFLRTQIEFAVQR